MVKQGGKLPISIWRFELFVEKGIISVSLVINGMYIYYMLLRLIINSSNNIPLPSREVSFKG